MIKKYIIIELCDVNNIITEPKMRVAIGVVEGFKTSKMFYDTYEEAETELMQHFNGVYRMYTIIPIYSSTIEEFKLRWKVD